MAFIVGLTGGIGSGKSTIADMFAQHNVPIIDADIVARQVVEKGSPLLEKIAQHFGENILNAQGELNRPALRERIFHNPEDKQWLNDLLHPAIRQEMLRQLEASNSPYVLWVVPLLIENKLTHFCDRVLVIDVKPEIQFQRALKRDQSQAETIKKMMQSQVDRQTRLSYADDVIENNQHLVEALPTLMKQVAELHHLYLTLANQKDKK